MEYVLITIRSFPAVKPSQVLMAARRDEVQAEVVQMNRHYAEQYQPDECSTFETVALFV